MFQHLPVEVVEAVIQRVDDVNALTSLRLVSRAFHRLVDPFLFHTVILNEYRRQSRRLRLFCDAVDMPGPNISSRASLVKHLTLRSLAPTRSPENVLNELSQTLAKLVKLETFNLDSLAEPCHSGPPCPVLRVLAGEQMPFSLKSLIWRHFECDKEPLDAIVNRHVNLERLEIPRFKGEIELSPHVLSRLRILQCPILTALPILPGRNITHLKVVIPNDFVPVAMDSFRHIRVFSGFGKWDLVAALVRQMPELECLELHPSTGIMSGAAYPFQVRPWHAALPEFILSTNPRQIRNIHIKQHIYLRWIVKSEDIQECFTVLPTLQWLQAPQLDNGKFYRWSRDNISESSSVTLDDKWDWVDGWMA